MKALLSLNEEAIQVTGKDDEELLMHIKDQIINRLDDELDELNEELHGGESENCAADLEHKISKLEREHERVCSRDDIAGLRWMGYSINTQLHLIP